MKKLLYLTIKQGHNYKYINKISLGLKMKANKQQNKESTYHKSSVIYKEKFKLRIYISDKMKLVKVPI